MLTCGFLQDYKVFSYVKLKGIYMLYLLKKNIRFRTKYNVSPSYQTDSCKICIYNSAIESTNLVKL